MGEEFYQAAEHLVAVSPFKGEGQLGRQQAIFRPEIVAAAAGFEGQVSFPPRQLGKGRGQVDTSAAGIASDQGIQQAHDCRCQDVHPEKAEVMPGPQARHHELLLRLGRRGFFQDIADLVQTRLGGHQFAADRAIVGQFAFVGRLDGVLRYEQDPELRALYRRGYERSHEVVRVEQNAWFNFLYGALTGHDCEPGHAVEHLRGWPLDLRVWSYQNSHRADLRTPRGYVALKGGTKTFPPRETEPLRLDHWLMQADGGAGGNDVVEPSGWLLAYWLGRYHGFIAAPTVTHPQLLTVEHTHGRELGAKPYVGPGRPAGF